MADGPKKESKRYNARGLTVGFEIAGAVGVLCLLGYWFDRSLGTSPWGIVIGACLGIVGGLYNVVRPAVRSMLNDRASRRNGRPDREK